MQLRRDACMLELHPVARFLPTIKLGAGVHACMHSIPLCSVQFSRLLVSVGVFVVRCFARAWWSLCVLCVVLPRRVFALFGIQSYPLSTSRPSCAGLCLAVPTPWPTVAVWSLPDFGRPTCKPHKHVQHSFPNPVGEPGLMVHVVDVPAPTCALQLHMLSEPGTSFVRCAKARLS